MSFTRRHLSELKSYIFDHTWEFIASWLIWGRQLPTNYMMLCLLMSWKYHFNFLRITWGYLRDGFEDAREVFEFWHMCIFRVSATWLFYLSHFFRLISDLLCDLKEDTLGLCNWSYLKVICLFNTFCLFDFQLHQAISQDVMKVEF